MPDIPGYDYGTGRAARSPVTPADFESLERAAGFTEEDHRALRMAGDVLADQAEALVDSWRTQIAHNADLAKWFFAPDGKPDERYKAAVKRRFVQWVSDFCTRPRDQAWLDYQEEIGLRHTPAKKNKTEGAQTPDKVPLRYLLAFAPAVVLGVKPFLARKGHSTEDVERMHTAWSKSVMLQLALWARPYVRDDLW